MIGWFGFGEKQKTKMIAVMLNRNPNDSKTIRVSLGISTPAPQALLLARGPILWDTILTLPTGRYPRGVTHGALGIALQYLTQTDPQKLRRLFIADQDSIRTTG